MPIGAFSRSTHITPGVQATGHGYLHRTDRKHRFEVRNHGRFVRHNRQLAVLDAVTGRNTATHPHASDLCLRGAIRLVRDGLNRPSGGPDSSSHRPRRFQGAQPGHEAQYQHRCAEGWNQKPAVARMMGPLKRNSILPGDVTMAFAAGVDDRRRACVRAASGTTSPTAARRMAR